MAHADDDCDALCRRQPRTLVTALVVMLRDQRASMLRASPKGCSPNLWPSRGGQSR